MFAKIKTKLYNITYQFTVGGSSILINDRHQAFLRFRTYWQGNSVEFDCYIIIALGKLGISLLLIFFYFFRYSLNTAWTQQNMRLTWSYSKNTSGYLILRNRFTHFYGIFGCVFSNSAGFQGLRSGGGHVAVLDIDDNAFVGGCWGALHRTTGLAGRFRVIIIRHAQADRETRHANGQAELPVVQKAERGFGGVGHFTTATTIPRETRRYDDGSPGEVLRLVTTWRWRSRLTGHDDRSRWIKWCRMKLTVLADGWSTAAWTIKRAARRVDEDDFY